MTPEAFLEFTDLLPEPMLLLSADARIICANRAMAEVVALSPDEIPGRSLLDLTSDSADKLQQYLRNCASSRQLVLGALSLIQDSGKTVKYRCDGALLKPAGSQAPAVILLRCQPSHVLDNRFIVLKRKIDELNREIGERRRSELALRENEAVLNGVINNSTAVIYIKDLDGRYLLVNEQFEKVFNVDGGQIKGKSDFDIFNREFAEKYRRHDHEVINSREAIHFEESARQDDGQHQYISVKFPLARSSGEIYAICGISTDITDLKRAEQQIRVLNDHLEKRVQQRTAQLVQVNEDLEAFSYSVSHDLRAPLRSIDGFSHILLEDYEQNIDETGRDYLKRICASTKRMGQLIDDILKLSRIGRQEVECLTVNLSDMVSEVVASLREQDTSRSVEVNIQPGVSVRADEKLIRIALENLLNNAWKYTGKQPDALIEFGIHQQVPEAVYYVRDNGIGFDMSNSDDLFTPFKRLHGEEFQGTGIGLATVKRIIHCHHGRIWAESESGRGAGFYFTLAC